MVEEGRRRKKELFGISSQSRNLRSLATTLLVSKLLNALIGLVLVLVETTAWLVVWSSSQAFSSTPIFLLLPTPLSSFLWLVARSRTKNPSQVFFENLVLH